jgi:hypothetical protein
MPNSSHKSPPNKTALRNALFAGYLLPNVDGTGVFARLGTHHIRCFAGVAQIKALVKQGSLEQTSVEPHMGLGIYTLTKTGERRA